MRTLGIDLAAQDKNTAHCAIEWISERASVELPRAGRPEGELLDVMQRADWIGIDVPFGWPDAIVLAIADYAETGETGEWPEHAPPEKLRYRGDRPVRAHAHRRRARRLPLAAVGVLRSHRGVRVAVR